MKLTTILTEAIDEQQKKKLYNTLAQDQRGKPEQAMLKVQRIYGGGVLSPVVEHTGDLIHRMSEHNTWSDGGYEAVKEKVSKVLLYLEYPYGFEKEMDENIYNNAKFSNTTYKALKKDVINALHQYAQAHKQLRTYNEVQQLANNAAIAVGRMKWKDAVKALKQLQKYIQKGRAFWTEKAHEYRG